MAGSERSTLLVSSPQAIVYYHVDAGPNLLWHIRGRKRLWVYPANNRVFVPRELMEDISASVRTENLPYTPEFDQAALVYDLEPGQVVAWPQNSPHRIQNLDTVNVSLNTEFATKQTDRRVLVNIANRFFSRRCHLRAESTTETGAWPRMKCFT
jgi:Cupin-like domain